MPPLGFGVLLRTASPIGVRRFPGMTMARLNSKGSSRNGKGFWNFLTFDTARLPVRLESLLAHWEVKPFSPTHTPYRNTSLVGASSEKNLANGFGVKGSTPGSQFLCWRRSAGWESRATYGCGLSVTLLVERFPGLTGGVAP